MSHIAEGLETVLQHQEPKERPALEEPLKAFTGMNGHGPETVLTWHYYEPDIPDISSTSKDLIEHLESILQHRETTESLYDSFRRAVFSLNDGEKWFFLDKDGKKCVAVSAREALEEDKWKWMFLAESRFEEVADYCNLPKFSIFCKFRSKLLSPETTYGAYLVYKLPEGYKYVNPPPVTVVDKDSHPKEVHSIFLRTPQTQVISYNAKGTAMNPSNMPKMKGLPKQRSDGWMEVQIHEFQTRPTLKMVSTRLSLSSYDMGLQGITVQCLEFRPI